MLSLNINKQFLKVSSVCCYFQIFYEGLYLYQKTGVNTARTLYIVVISQDLDLTLLYADWTSQEINSLTHSHL